MSDLSALLNGEVYGHSDHGSKRKIKKNNNQRNKKQKNQVDGIFFIYDVIWSWRLARCVGTQINTRASRKQTGRGGNQLKKIEERGGIVNNK